MRSKQLVLFSRMMLAVTICVISFLATTARHIPVAEQINDKINHIAAFYSLALFMDFSWPNSGFFGPKAASLFFYGLTIEFVQYFLPYRSFSLLDLGADTVGMVLFVVSIPVLRRIYPLSIRFEPHKE